MSNDDDLFGVDDEAVGGPDVGNRLRCYRVIFALSQGLRALMDRRLAKDGLTTQQAAVLTVARGKPSIRECADALSTTHQNVRQVVDALVRKGFLELVPDAHDARVKRLVTTKKNDRYWKGRDGDDHAAVLSAFEGLDAREAKQLLRLLVVLHGGTRRALAGGATSATAS